MKTLTVILLSLASAVYAECGGDSTYTAGLEFSGFMDMQFYGDLSKNQKPEYHWGQIELDFAKCVSPLISLEGAIAYDGETESFGVGAAFLQLNIMGCEGENLIVTRRLENCGLILGQFDVPFGIDWKVYPSIDRKLISAPLAVEEIHGRWNSAGAMIFAEKGRFNAVIFSVGFEDPADADSNYYDNLGETVGGRIGCKPFKNLEAGASIASDIVSGYPYQPTLAGFDVQFNYKSWQFKGEFIRKDYNYPVYAEKMGGYGEIMYNPGKYFAVYRGELLQTGGTDDEQRHCLGLGYVLSKGAEVRSEFQINPDAENYLILQAVVGF